MSSWYVVQTKSSKEFLAEQNLLNQFNKVYLPITNVKKFCKTKLVNYEKPLFPGYLFIFSKNINKDWHKINSTRGVKKIIHFGNSFCPIDQNFVNFLKSKEINGKIFLSKIIKLKKGKKYLICNEVFNKILCEVDSFLSREKICVLLNILGRKTKYVVSKKFLEPCLNT